MLPALIEFSRKLLVETVEISLGLFRIMIPIIIAVKILQELGAVDALGKILSPVMGIVGLPGSMGLVWATTILSNIYTGIVVFVAVTANEPLTVAQTTVLASMMLVAHNLPIELRIAQKAGARLRFMGLLRMGGAFVLGWGLFRIYRLAGTLQEQNIPRWLPHIDDTSIATWTGTQVRGLIMIFFIIMGLLLLLRILDRIGITAIMTRFLTPVLRLLGIRSRPVSLLLSAGGAGGPHRMAHPVDARGVRLRLGRVAGGALGRRQLVVVRDVGDPGMAVDALEFPELSDSRTRRP